MNCFRIHQSDRLRELEIELDILERYRSLEDRENIEYSIQYSDIYWPVSDRWKKRRADFIHRYDVTSYTIIPMEKKTSLYDSHFTFNENAWEHLNHTLPEGTGEEERQEIKQFNILRSLHIFEMLWEINAMFDCVVSSSFDMFRIMEKEIAAMDLTSYYFTSAWDKRRAQIAEYLEEDIDAEVENISDASSLDTLDDLDNTDEEFDTDDMDMDDNTDN
jgi:hypothetical protein